MQNPFRRAAERPKNVKLLIYGASGVGKTSIALQFPRPCVIDLESGTSQYSEKYSFDVVAPQSYKELTQAIDFLLNGGAKNYETIVIDPITIAWESLQADWQEIFLQRNSGGKGDKKDFYALQPADWVHLKSRWKELMRDLIALPLNVVAIAREKAQYADGQMMQKIGSTFDSEKSLDYWFDSVVQLCWDGNKRKAVVHKDRTGKLPEVGKRVDLNFSLFAGLLSQNSAPSPTNLVTPDLENKLRQDTAWLLEKLPFKASNGASWDDLGKDLSGVEKDGKQSSGRQYLHQLAGWTDEKGGKEEIRLKAKIALELGEKYVQSLEQAPF